VALQFGVPVRADAVHGPRRQVPRTNQAGAIPKSMSLKYEPASEALHISVIPVRVAEERAGRVDAGSELHPPTLEVTQGQILSESPTDATSSR